MPLPDVPAAAPSNELPLDRWLLQAPDLETALARLAADLLDPEERDLLLEPDEREAPEGLAGVEAITDDWRTWSEEFRERIERIAIGWIERPGEAAERVARHLGEGRDLGKGRMLDLGARLAGFLDLDNAADAILRRLKIGPPSAEVVIAAGKLEIRDALLPLRELARREPKLRHAALAATLYIDHREVLPALEEEYLAVSDLVNDAAARRGDLFTQTTFQTLVEAVVRQHGIEALPEIAERLRGPNPIKNRMLADYLCAVAREPALLAQLPAEELVAEQEAAIRRELID